MVIEELSIENYKSIKKVENLKVDKRIFSFIGQNNTGKSAVLDAIQCFFPNIKKSITEKDYHKGIQDDVIIKLVFAEVTKDYIEEKLFSDLRKRYENKLLEIGDDPQKREKENEKFNKKMVDNIEKYTNIYQIDNEKLIVTLRASKGMNKKYYLKDEITSISESDLKKILPELKIIPAIRDPKNESTAGTNSYLKELIQMLDDSIQTSIKVGKDNVTYSEINTIISKESEIRCNKISKIISKNYSNAIGNSDYEIQVKSEVNISKGTSYYTTLKEVNTGVVSDILSCGTGYQSMIILSLLETYVQMTDENKNYILIIEEPEVYLHPTLQRKMIRTLLKISNYNQVLFSTHSPIMVSSLSKEQIIMLHKKNGIAELLPIDINQVINDLGIKPDILFEKIGTIFVEGSDDEICVKLLLEKIKKGLSNEIKVVIAGNCSNLKFYANAEMMIYSGNFKWLALRDADNLKAEEQKELFIKEILDINKERLEKYKEKVEKSVYIVGEYSIESLFMDENILKKIYTGDENDLKDAIKTYHKVFNFYKAKNISKNDLGKFYQPKYFFEKNYDAYGYEESENQKKWDESYKKRWRNADSSLVDLQSIENYLAVREAINKYTRQKKKLRENYFEELLSSLSIEVLKSNKFKELIEVLSNFYEECK